MNKLEQAARQALEALEEYQAGNRTEFFGAITALRKALGKPELWYCNKCGKNHCQCPPWIESNYKPVEQTEQEPIMRKATRDEKIVRPGVYEVPVEQSPQKTVGIYYGEVDGIGHRVRLDVELPIGTNLYAAPVRTKDLTDDEIVEALGYDKSYRLKRWVLDDARAVIAADREKNK